MECPAAQIVAGNPYYAFTRILVLLHGHRQYLRVGISPLARVHPSATIGPDVSLHADVTVCEEARIGRGTILYPGVFVGPGSEVGEDYWAPHGPACERAGDRVLIHAGACIGTTGWVSPRAGASQIALAARWWTMSRSARMRTSAALTTRSSDGSNRSAVAIGHGPAGRIASWRRRGGGLDSASAITASWL
jgi:acetyltransferase-like isoleucine patch superfamily enzyme